MYASRLGSKLFLSIVTTVCACVGGWVGVYVNSRILYVGANKVAWLGGMHT